MSLQSSPVVNLYWLDQIHSDQLRTVGVKALHLSHLKQLGCPVLPGFVVGSQVLPSVLESIQWEVPLFTDLPSSSLRLNTNNAKQLQTIARQLRQAIKSAPLPEALLNELDIALKRLPSSTFLLRPSLVVDSSSRSVTQQSSPDVVFHPSALIDHSISNRQVDSLAQGMKRLWAELFGAKSLFYWQHLNIPLQQVKLAVLIQPLQSAIASGTLRLVNNQLELCATVGLAAIERGEVLPDTYQIQPETGRILSQTLGQKSIGYQIASSESSISSTEGIDLDRMEMYLLDDQQRLRYALTEPQVHQVVQLAQIVWAGMGSSMELEWMLVPDEAGDAQAYVTQVAPQAALPVLPVRPNSNLVPPPKKGIELFPDATFIASGVAASPGHAIAQASVLRDTTVLPNEIPPYTVLIAPTIPLDWMHLVRQAVGLVSEQGSLTSHSAIVAREIGVPAVMGVEGATQQIQTGELIWVDGDRGDVYRLPRSAQITETLAPLSAKPSLPESIQRLPTKTKLWVNISQPAQLVQVANLAVDGVGLLRGELLALAVLDHQHPAHWLEQHQEQEFIDRMAAAIAQFAETFPSRPVIYRSFDLRAHEFSTLKHHSSATSYSMLGMRGTYRYLMEPTLFKLELQALLAVQQMGYSNVCLMLPFVRTVEEFQFCRQLVQKVGLMQQCNFQLWIMAEVPSVLLLLPDYVEAGVQGISIGTNDLTQLLLGVDRDDAQLANAFEERHPAVKRAIAQLIREARTLGIPCSICGEAPVRYPELIADLIAWGIDSISATPEAIEATYQEIIKAERA